MKRFKHLLLTIGCIGFGLSQIYATTVPNKHRPFLLTSVSWVGGAMGAETDWNTPTNWSPSGVPISSNDVIIPTGLTHYPVLNTNTAIQSLSVEMGASLTVNTSFTLTISGAGANPSLNVSGTINNNGTISITATSDAFLLNGNAQFNNNAGATLTVTTTGNYGLRIGGSAVMTNQTGAFINSTGNSGSLLFSGNDTPIEMVKNYGMMTLTGQIEKYSDNLHNYPCGVIKLLTGDVFNNGGQIINEGYFSVLDNINGTPANFLNNGILYVDGSTSFTNNKIQINKSPTTTSIFSFGGSNDLTIEGIYKDGAATMSAGSYNQTSNTFTPTPTTLGGNPATLYAKITRPSNTCPQIVPFSINLPGFVNTLSNQTICAGNATFSLIGFGISTFQWQESSDAAFTSPTNLSTGGIYTVSSTGSGTTLTIAYNASVNGKYYRCIGNGGTYLSNSAMLTVASGPNATISYTGSPYLNIGMAMVTLTGTTGGTFSAVPAGLSLNTSTGAVNLATSTPGNYTVTYTLAASGPCPIFTTTAAISVVNAVGLYVWTGAINTQWHNLNNWLVNGGIPSVLPTFGSKTGNHVQIPVVISNNYPEVSTAGQGARSIIVAASARLNILSSGDLKVVGSDTDGLINAGIVTNAGTMLVDSAYNDGFINQEGGIIVNTGSFEIRNGTGTRLKNYGNITHNSGTFNIGGGLNTGVINYPRALLINRSTFSINGGNAGSIINQGTIDNFGQLTTMGIGTALVNLDTLKNRPSALLNLRGNKLNLDNAHYIINEGTVQSSGIEGMINRFGAKIFNTLGATFSSNGLQKNVAFRNSGYLENKGYLYTGGNPDSCFLNTFTGEVLNNGTANFSATARGGLFNEGKFTNGATGAIEAVSLSPIAISNSGVFLSSVGCTIRFSGVTHSFLNTSTGVFDNQCITTLGSLNNGIENYGRYTQTGGSLKGGSMNRLFQNFKYAYLNVPIIIDPTMGTLFTNSDSLILGSGVTITRLDEGGFSTPFINSSTGYLYSDARMDIGNTSTILNNDGKVVFGPQSVVIGYNMGTPFINTGSFTNEGSINVNRFGNYAINNTGTFKNKGHFETGNSGKSIYNNGGIIENAGVIEIDSVFLHGVEQAGPASSFTNTATGQINIDFVFGNGIKNTAGSFVNNGDIFIAQTDTVALSGIENVGNFQNNKLIRIGGAGKINQHGVYNTGTFTNGTNSQLFVQSATGSGITNQGGSIINQGCAYIESIPAILNAAGSFSNAGIIKKKQDNLTAISNISSNTSNIINEDADAFNVTGINSGNIISITSPSTPLGIGQTRTLTAIPTGGVFSVTGPGTLLNNVLTATGTGTITVNYAFNLDPNCPYYAQQNIGTINVVMVNITGSNNICAGTTTTLSPTLGGTWTSSNTAIAIVANDGTVTGLSAGIVNFTFTPTGCTTPDCQATTANITIRSTPTSALSASTNDVCPNTEVSLDAHCSIAGSSVLWNPGAPTVTPDAATTPYIYRASCSFEGCAGNESSVEVRTHRILVDLKDVGLGAQPKAIVGAKKDNLAPTNTILAAVSPRLWTILATGCSASESAVFRLTGPINFSSIDNNPPYAIFANVGATYFSIDHPNYGNGGSSFPNGIYNLVVDLRAADGVGGPFPKNRIATGSLLATRSLHFTVSASGVRQGIEDLSLEELNWASIFQNPVNEEIVVRLSGTVGEEVSLGLVNLQGQTVQSRAVKLSSPQQYEVLNVRQQNAGMYILKAIKGDKVKTIKVVKSE